LGKNANLQKDGKSVGLYTATWGVSRNLIKGKGTLQRKSENEGKMRRGREDEQATEWSGKDGRSR